MVPTRELAVQCAQMIQRLGEYTNVQGRPSSGVIHGKASGGVEAKTGNCRCDTG